MSLPFTRFATLTALLAVIAVALLAVLPARAQAPRTPGDAIVATALEDVGTWGGQCWPWVREVVERATGNKMGFGYHDGFIEGGAIEVSLASAIPGDIIQIADPNNNGPGASYRGLHTAIVKVNHGDGTFDVIDSNSQFNEMVRIRPNYDPVWAANRYPNVKPRVYRFTDGSATKPMPEPPAVELPDLRAGDAVRVTTGSENLFLRSGAGTGNTVLARLPHGTTLTVDSAPVASGSYAWVRVRTSTGQTGWVATDFIERVETSAPGASDGAIEDLDRDELNYKVIAPALSSAR